MGDMSATDFDYLIKRARVGDREAWDTLYWTILPGITAIVLNKLSGLSYDEKKDIVQNAILSVAKGLDRLRDPSRFKAWAHRRARFECVNEIRRRRQRDSIQEPYEVTDLPSQGLSPEETLIRSHCFQCINEWLITCDPPVQTVISLTSQGLQAVEIANLTGMNINTVRSHRHRWLIDTKSKCEKCNARTSKQASKV
jgi:RNA polymerase sigma factor (sigma-70 family)